MDEELETAGRADYYLGRPRSAALSETVSDALRGRQVGDPRNIEIMEAWYRGWDAGRAADERVTELFAMPRAGETETLYLV